MIDLDLVEYDRYHDLEFSMQKGASYVRQLTLVLVEQASLPDALTEWLLSVRYQTVWRYIYQWLSWQPTNHGISAQEAVVAVLRNRLANADLLAASTALGHFRQEMRRFPIPDQKQEEVEKGLAEATAVVDQRWDQLDSYRQQLETLLVGWEAHLLRGALERAQLSSSWVVLRQLMEKKGGHFSMPERPSDDLLDAPVFARSVMEVLDAAGQVPHAGALHGAAHEFEKYPRLLAQLLANRDPLEAIDLWFAKLLREEEIRFSTLARIYVAFDEFRRVAKGIEEGQGKGKLDRLIRYIGSAAIFFAFQYAFERDQADRFRRQLGERLDLKDEAGTLQRLLSAVSALYAHEGWPGVEAALEQLVGPDHQALETTLRDAASALLRRDDRGTTERVQDRSRTLLEQSLRLAIYRPSALRAATGASVGDNLPTAA